LSRSGVEAVELAGRAEGIDLPLVKRRRGPRPQTTNRLVEAGVVRVPPQLVAGPGVIAHHQLDLVELFLRVQPRADDREGTPARTDAVPPHLRRGLLIPVSRDPDSRQAGIAIGPAKARPIARP